MIAVTLMIVHCFLYRYDKWQGVPLQKLLQGIKSEATVRCCQTVFSGDPADGYAKLPSPVASCYGFGTSAFRTDFYLIMIFLFVL